MSDVGEEGQSWSLEDASIDFEDLETVFCGLLLGAHLSFLKIQ